MGIEVEKTDADSTPDAFGEQLTGELRDYEEPRKEIRREAVMALGNKPAVKSDSPKCSDENPNDCFQRTRRYHKGREALRLLHPHWPV